MRAENYLKWARFTWWNYKLFAQMLARLIDRDIERILDIGCGNGLLLDELKVFFPNSTIVGVDLLKSMLTVRTQKNPVVIGRAEKLPFKSNTFDLVTCMYSLHEFQVKKAVEEIYRILKDGCFLSIKDVNCDAPKWALIYIEQILRLFFDRKTVKRHISLYSSFKKPEKLIQLFEINGFEVVNIKKSLLDFTLFCVKTKR